MSDPFLIPFKQRLAKEKPKPTNRIQKIQTEFKFKNAHEDIDRQRLTKAQQHIEQIKKEQDEFLLNIEKRSDESKETEKPKTVLEQLFAESVDQSQTENNIASKLSFCDEKIVKTTRKITKPCTSIIIDRNNSNIIYVGSLDGKIMIYDSDKNEYIGELNVPTKANSSIRSEILDMTMSSDGKYLVCAANDKRLIVYDVITKQMLGCLHGHQDIVSGCVFREGSYEVYSCSYDRSVKIWNIENLSLMDTLYGHHQNVNCIDALSKERCVTGSNDKSVRIFKISEESQLIYNAYNSIDCVSLVNEMSYVAGSFNGSLSVYIVSKKTPKFVVENAHKQVTALCAVKYSDMVISGGVEGDVKLWRVSVPSANKRVDVIKLELISEINVGSCVNSISVTKDNKMVVCALGKRYRLGDWNVISNAVNGVCCLKLRND